MSKNPLLSGLMLVGIGVALASAATTAEAHHMSGNLGVAFGLSFGSPGYDNGYYDNGYDNSYNNGFYDNRYGYYDQGYYDDGYYDGGYRRSYRHHYRHVSHHCHVGQVRYHHRLHDARICDGQVKVIY